MCKDSGQMPAAQGGELSKPDVWVDTRIVRFDDTIVFGHGGFDFDAWESLRWEMHTPHGSFAVWKSGRKSWSLYGGPEGVLALDRYSCEEHAKADAEMIALSLAEFAALSCRPAPMTPQGASELAMAGHALNKAIMDWLIYVEDDAEVSRFDDEVTPALVAFRAFLEAHRQQERAEGMPVARQWRVKSTIPGSEWSEWRNSECPGPSDEDCIIEERALGVIVPVAQKGELVASAVEAAHQATLHPKFIVEKIVCAYLAALDTAPPSPQPKPREQMPAAQGGELLPCPFCGSNDIYDAINYDSYIVEIECQGCGAIIDAPLSQSDENSYEESVEIIAGLKARWNRRPAPMTPQGASEEAKALVEAFRAAVLKLENTDPSYPPSIARSAAYLARTEAALLDALEAPHPQQERAEGLDARKIIEHYADLFCELSQDEEACGHLDDDDCSGCKARAWLSRRADERGQP